MGADANSKVVIADDADDVRFLLRLVVESASGFEVVAEAVDGREAVEAVETHRPDVILLDVSMPIMDGLEAIPLIRKAVPGIKIVMVSGLDTSYVGPTALGLGADGYVEKSSGRDALLDAILRIVRGDGAAGY